jgi:hypothetical protein
VPSTFSRDPTRQLRLAGISSITAVVCPNCRQTFKGKNGIGFPCHYKRGNESLFGPLLFCGEYCALEFLDPRELDRC